MSDLRLALAQINTVVGDIAGNAAKVLAASRTASVAGAHLVVFPEMTLTGYPIEDLALRDSVQQASKAAVTALATDLESAGCGNMTVVVGYLDTDADGRPTNSAAVLRGGLVTDRYSKHHLPNYGVFDEFRIFASGTSTCAIDVGGRTVGIAICEDLWQEGGPVAALTDLGVDLLVVLNGSPFEVGKIGTRLQLAQHRARALGGPLAYVNLVGAQDDLVFDGGSFVVDGHGDLMARAPQFVDDLLIVDIAEGGAISPSAELVPELSDIEQTYHACVLGLADYVVKNGFKTVTLGLSGGIDSALVAIIAADAVGAENVVGVSMPSRYSSDHSKDDAADSAERIGLSYRVEPIAGKVAGFLTELPVTGIAEENLQARMRGMTLMALSNQEGHLVLATGNKSELAVGYSTIYGDAVGGFAPIKDVLKTQVWELSRWRNELARSRGEVEPIPESSITKPPSAELRPDQKDSDSLPDYELLDAVLERYIELGASRVALLADDFDPATIDKVLALVDRAEWKRRQYPPGPKVTSLAFGRDRRLPMTSLWREP